MVLFFIFEMVTSQLSVSRYWWSNWTSLTVFIYMCTLKKKKNWFNLSKMKTYILLVYTHIVVYMSMCICVWQTSTVGYTMKDIQYKWKDGLQSVGISNEVQLPQIRVLGYRQKATEIFLSTGNARYFITANFRSKMIIIILILMIIKSSSKLDRLYRNAFQK